jgi:hypothetical protein
MVTACRGVQREHRHNWLVHRGLIVDLTADQFSSENQPNVMVSDVSAWHATWEPIPREDFVINSERAKRIRENWYESRYQKVVQALNLLNQHR